jgi:hypothetical protein
MRVGDLVVFPYIANCSGIIKEIHGDNLYVQIHWVDQPPVMKWVKSNEVKLYECKECKKGFNDEK